MKDNLITQCAYCKRWETEQGWKKEKPSDAIEGIDGNVTHGICPECQKKKMKEIEES
ncbi:MAG: hypothetical protein ACFFC1_06230 [Promethearchaeota archaeon]